MFAAASQSINLVADTQASFARQLLVDQPIHLRLSGFAARQPVTLQAVYSARDGVWNAQATFLTDDNGGVDVATQAPLSGSYTQSDAMGLFWSMQLEATTQSAADNRIELTATQAGRQPAVATIERLFVAPGVKKKVVRERGLFGTLFTPPGTGPHPGLLVLGGSAGGLPEIVAQMLASHGYATLALAYFRYESLPAELLSIPLEYFETALSWMQAQDDIRDDQIGVYGISKGGELALLLGSTFPTIKAVVAVVPSAVVWQGLSAVETNGFAVGGGDAPAAQSSWSHHGEDLPFVPFKVSPEFAQAMKRALVTRAPISLTPVHLHGLARADAGTLERAAIRVEQTRGPILLVSGQDDQLWPSTVLSEMVIARLAKHHYGHPYRHLQYPGAGHLMTIPHQPTTSNTGGMTAFKMAFGGEPDSQAAAVRDAWTHLLVFLAQALSPDKTSALNR